MVRTAIKNENKVEGKKIDEDDIKSCETLI
jgi:hypothetical protein